MKRHGTYLWLLLFSIAVVGFALTAHRDMWLWLRWLFLLLTAIALWRGWIMWDDPIRIIVGKARLSHPCYRVAVAACLGAMAAIGYRRLIGTSVLLDSLHWFAVVAMAIGMTEELLWRGWMQGSLTETLGAARAVLITAGSHASYKTALFVFAPASLGMRPPGALFLIAALTFGFGSVLGFFRARQGTIAAPVAFHMLFDLLVYGESAKAPWWVW